ncbi:hypothetical protein ACNO5M_13955 [Vibrio owensii]|uniref:hypothetical protein n=1 Tax=Vibrio owensii TaxID=696485 RepID=UPI003AAC2DF6
MMFEKYQIQIELHLCLMLGALRAQRVLNELEQDNDFHVKLRLIVLTINSIVGRHHHLHDELFQASPDIKSDTDLSVLMLDLFDVLDEHVTYDSLMHGHTAFGRFIRTPLRLVDLHIKNGALKSLRSIWTE